MNPNRVPLRVTFVAAEGFPFFKVGGLGDVVGGLSVCLAERGTTVRVIMPWYRGISAAPSGVVAYEYAGARREARVGTLQHEGVEFTFVETGGFGSDSLYGTREEVPAFVQFCVAASQLIDTDILHAHDWQTGLLMALARAGRLKAKKTLLTFHNFAYQGFAAPRDLSAWTGLPAEAFACAPANPDHGQSLSRIGILLADRLSTVSPSYAREIQTPEFGAGLDELLRTRTKDLSGILNGIDARVWNPADDAHLPARFSTYGSEGKRICQARLKEELGLSGPILGVVSRLVAQKGVDIVRAAIPDILRLGYSLAVLGSGEPELESAFTECTAKYPGRFRFTRGFNDPLAHRIYAGCDGLLMPSRFEPCGLTQMIAQRYGTPPIARGVGGLRDTIEHGRTGILFEEEGCAGLLAGIIHFRLHPDHAAMAEAGMARDWSWHAPAARYEQLYGEMLACP